MGHYASGGSNAYWDNSSLSLAKIQGGAGASSSVFLKDDQDVTPYDEVRVRFWYYASNVDSTNDNFFLEYSPDGGNTWEIVREFIFGHDFLNNGSYQVEVPIPRTAFSLTKRARIRFRCDTNTAYKQIWIDDVAIGGISNAS